MLLGKRASELNPFSKDKKSSGTDNTPQPREPKRSKSERRGSSSDPASGSGISRGTPSRREVGPWLKNLMRAESINDAQAQEAMKVMRELQQQCGPYLLASDIQNYLNRLPSKDDRGRVYNKDRGFGLAAELFLREAYRQIDAIEVERLALGPSLFADYCVDIIDCFFARKNSRKGAEAPVALAEYLVQKAVDSPVLAEQYFTLARTALKTGQEAAAVRHEKEMQASRASSRKERGTEATPLVDGSTGIPAIEIAIDQGVMSYLRDVQRKFNQLQQGFERFGVNPNGSAEQDASKRFQISYEEMQGLLRLVHGIEYHPITGYLKERLGALSERVQPGTGADFYRAAGGHYELQADKEKALQLMTLATDRYKHASRLYGMANEPALAQRVADKSVNGAVTRKTA